MESGRRGLAALIGRWLADGLFPRRCVGCRQEGAWMCADCHLGTRVSESVSACPFCGSEEGGEGKTCEACAPRSFLDGCTALGRYREPALRETIRLWKYHGDPELWDILRERISTRAPATRLPAADWTVCHLPLHAARKRERGFDQAERIAKAVAEACGYPFTPLLRRPHWTDPQAQRGSADRRVGDMDGAFTAVGAVPAHVLLCDDVLTSGSTLDAAARALKAAGAETVWGLVLARK